MKGKIAKKSQYETIASTTVRGERTSRAGFEGRGKVKKTDLEHTLTVKNESANSVSKTNDDNLATAGAGGAVIGKSLRSQRRIEKDEQRLSQDNWLARNGHSLTYAGIFLFTLVLYFRPYELIPALSGFQSMAVIFAIATLLIYLPSQFTAEGTLTALPIEVKCILFIAIWALLTIPLAKNPRLAWETYNDTFIKVALMFIIMVNTLRTSARLKGLMWLGIGVGVMLSFQALDLYSKGEFKTEGYRVSVDFGGMFGNPNDMAIHLVIFIPIAVALGAAASNKFIKLLFFACAAMMTAGSFVTQSRGAFIGIVTVGAVLVWKLGHAQRFKAVLIASVVGLVIILLAPGNYGLRVMSIFIPSLDPVGSSDQRTELLIRSIWVTLRNPLGIGIGNFEIVGSHNLGTHNAYTQVSVRAWLACVWRIYGLANQPISKAWCNRKADVRKAGPFVDILSIDRDSGEHCRVYGVKFL